MTAELRKRVKKLEANVRKNKPRVRRMLNRAGAPAEAALVFTVALYFKTLNKLAKD
ncbi:MAG TPA: hypothetical protein VGA40_05525 [Candidatus Acidoferrales bacterium]